MWKCSPGKEQSIGKLLSRKERGVFERQRHQQAWSLESKADRGPGWVCRGRLGIVERGVSFGKICVCMRVGDVRTRGNPKVLPSRLEGFEILICKDLLLLGLHFSSTIHSRMLWRCIIRSKLSQTQAEQGIYLTLEALSLEPGGTVQGSLPSCPEGRPVRGVQLLLTP